MLTDTQAASRSRQKQDGDSEAMPMMMPRGRHEKRNGTKPEGVLLQQSLKVVRTGGVNVSRPTYPIQTQNTLREIIKYAADACAFGPPSRETMMQAVHKTIEEKASISKTGSVTPAAWEKAMGECFDQSAAHYHLYQAHAARQENARPWPSIKKALAHLDIMGVKERWHLTYKNTGISPAAWKAYTGESFEASIAKRHFTIIQEKKKRNEGFNNVAMTMMARKYASAAGVQKAEELEKTLQIKPATWEKVTGEPFAPLKGTWRVAGHHVGKDGKTLVPMESFCLTPPVKIGPNSTLG